MALTDSQLLQLIGDRLQDNASEDITPAEVREVLTQLVQAKVNLLQLANYAQLASPKFSGAPEVPTAAAGTNTNQVASTGFVQAALAAAIAGKGLTELVLPMAVTGGNWYVTMGGLWEARRSFSAAADPVNGANWRQVASFTGPAVTITADSITDATPAGRRLLTAASAAQQRALLGNPNIALNQYGLHPAFSSEDGPDGAWAWVIKGILGSQKAVAPDAPTDGQVDDVAKLFSFLANPLFPAAAQYKVSGLPGVTGPVFLDATNSYMQAGRIVIKVGPGVPKNNLAVFVAGSGSRPDGAVLTNGEAFTGSATPVSTATKATAPRFGAIDDVNNVVSLSSNYAYTEVQWGVEGQGPQALGSNSICSPGNIAGRLYAYVVADAAANRLQSDTVYSDAFTLATTAPTNNAPTVSLSSPQAGQTLDIGDPVVLNAAPQDADGASDIKRIDYYDNGVKFTETNASPHTVQRNLTAGAHSFTARVYDMVGASGLSNAVAVAAQASTTPSITSASPSGGAVGSDVTIAGNNFGPNQGNGSVTINGIIAQVRSWAANLIVIVIPSAATTGPLVVTTDSGASAAVNYTVQVNNALTVIDIPEAAWQCNTLNVDYLGGKLRNTFAYIEFDTFATQLDLQGITELGAVGYADQASFGVFVGTPDNIGLPGTFSQNAQFGGSSTAGPTPIWIGLTGITGSGSKRVRVMIPAPSRNGAGTQNIISTVLLKLRANASVSFVTTFPTYDSDYFIGEDSIASGLTANMWVDPWPLRLRVRLRGIARVLVNSIAGASLSELYGAVGYGQQTPVSQAPDKASYRAQFASSAANVTNIFIYGANDAGRLNTLPADYGTAYGNLLDDMHMQNAAAKQVIITPFTTRDFESRLAPMRSAIADVVSARSWAKQFAGPPAFAGIPGPSRAGDPNDGAGIHPGTVQHASIENYIWASLNNVDPNLFSDNFPGNILNQRWVSGIAGGNPSGATVAIVNDALKITAQVGPGQQTGVTSALPYDLTKYAFQTQIGTLFVTRPESGQYIGFYPDGSTQGLYDGYELAIGNGSLVFLGPRYVEIAKIAYNATAHKWLRFLGDGSKVVVQVSADGVTWTNPFGITSSAPFNLANVRLLVGGGGGPSTDNVNWPTGTALGTATFLNAGVVLNPGASSGGTTPAVSVLQNSEFTDPVVTDSSQGWISAQPIGGPPYYQAGGNASIANGVGTVDAGNWLLQKVTLIANAVYKLEMKLNSISSGNAQVSGPGNAQINTTYGNASTGATPGTYSQTFTSPGGEAIFAVSVNGSGTAVVEYVSLTRLS